MRVFYIHQYFRTPDQGGAVRSYHLAKGLKEAGIEVEMITSHPHPHYDQRWIEGVKVHYLPVPYDQKFGFWKRIKAFFQFVSQSKSLLKKLPRPDLLYITSTPLTTGWIGLWAKKKMAVPFLFEVRDLWPEAPIQVGAIRNPLLIRYLRKLEKAIYEQALSLVALSPGIAQQIKQMVPEKEVALIPNFSDLDRFYWQEKQPELIQSLNLNLGLTIAYTGAIGQVNGVEELVDLAELAAKRGKTWNFLIMGEGSEKVNLENRVRNSQLKNIRFIPFGSKEKVNEILSLADFCWISFAHLPVLKTNSPNKFFDALAAGKAILVNHKGWVYDLVTTHQLGLAFLPHKWEKAFEQLEDLENDPATIRRMGQMSRKLAETYFSKEIAIARLAEILQPKPRPTQVGADDSQTA